jgi:hypothetical protein
MDSLHMLELAFHAETEHGDHNARTALASTIRTVMTESLEMEHAPAFHFSTQPALTASLDNMACTAINHAAPLARHEELVMMEPTELVFVWAVIHLGMEQNAKIVSTRSGDQLALITANLFASLSLEHAILEWMELETVPLVALLGATETRAYAKTVTVPITALVVSTLALLLVPSMVLALMVWLEMEPACPVEKSIEETSANCVLLDTMDLIA